jgi:hypothetical protein
MAAKQRPELVLERHLSMMLFLAFDVPFHLVQVGLAHGKRPVPSLPVKVRILWAGILGPLRTSLLHFLDDLLQRVIFGKGEQRMDVILNATDHDRGTIPFLVNPRLVREESIAVGFVNPGLASFGAVYQMNQFFTRDCAIARVLLLCRPFRARGWRESPLLPGRCPGLICRAPSGQSPSWRESPLLPVRCPGLICRAPSGQNPSGPTFRALRSLPSNPRAMPPARSTARGPQ